MRALGRRTRRDVLLAPLTAGVALGSAAVAQSFTPDDASRRAVVATYRTLHERPEVGKQEHFAKAYLIRQLNALPGLTFVDVPSLPTAIVAILDSGRPGPTIALRAELDARPLDAGVNEPAHHDPRSLIDGVMHNCGHDAHAAMLLGAAIELSSIRRQLFGKIVFLFQPAEEIRGGAEDIVADGVLGRLGVQTIFAQHCVPGLAVGQIQLSRGAFLAGSTTFTLTLRGAASHAAAPQDGSDLPLLAARIMAELAMFPARRLDIISRPVVISTTQITTNAETLNGLPSEVVMRGTIRAFEDIDKAPAAGQSIADLLQIQVEHSASSAAAVASLEFVRGSPPTVNDAGLHDFALPILQRVTGQAVRSSSYRGMFSEDFAFFSERLPALYFSLGIFKDGLGNVGVHQPDFTIHPDALHLGTGLLVALGRDVGMAMRR